MWWSGLVWTYDLCLWIHLHFLKSLVFTMSAWLSTTSADYDSSEATAAVDDDLGHFYQDISGTATTNNDIAGEGLGLEMARR